MKLVIDYDLIQEIQNAKEPFGPFKIVRQNKHLKALSVPLMFSITLALSQDVLQSLIILPFQVAVELGFEIFSISLLYQHAGDPYAKIAKDRLEHLVPRLKNLYVDTSYKLLLDSEVYHSEYKVHLNEKNLPYLLNSKYIIVPTYNSNGDIKRTSILQEHVVGSEKYVLSIGSKTKQFSTVRSRA